jgi:peptidoglycan-N-acetylglucosamine deacetylase
METLGGFSLPGRTRLRSAKKVVFSKRPCDLPLLGIVLRRMTALLAMLPALCFSAGQGSGAPDVGPSSPVQRPPQGKAEVRTQAAAPVQAAGATTTGTPFPLYLVPLPNEPPGPPARLPQERLILLTFDDGPDLQGTPIIMDELDRRKLHAVFFVMGQHIVRNRPEDMARRGLLRKLALHGHHVGNHTMNHKDLCRNPQDMAAEIDRAAELITYATGVRPVLFRSPYGARCRALDRALAQRDMIQVGWNADPREWRGNSDNAIFSMVTNQLARATAPVILLLHDKNLNAVQALPRILDWIEQEKARVEREGGIPIRIIDYSVLLPPAVVGQQPAM